MKVQDRSLNLTSAEFDATVSDSSLPVLVDFHASWCAPCQAMGPIVEDVAGRLAGETLVAKVNVEDEPQLAKRFGVTSIPAFLLFEGGEVARRFVGARSEEQIVKFVRGES